MNYASAEIAFKALENWCECNNVLAPMLVLWTRTSPGLLKKNRVTGEPCPYSAGVIHQAQRYGQIGCSYEACQQRKLSGALDLDGNEVVFRAGPLWGGKGKHVEGSRFYVTHVERGGLYVAFRPKQDSSGGIKLGYDKWLDAGSGEEIEKPVDYLPVERNEPLKIAWRTISVNNIVQINCGEVYRVAA